MFSLDIGTSIMSEYDSDEFLGFQFDHLGESDSGVPPTEGHHLFGFMSRPSDPDVDGDGNPTIGAQLLYLSEGSASHAFALEDPRVVPILPKLKTGESCMYGSDGQFFRCIKGGGVSMYTTHDGTPDGRTIALTLTPANGLEYQSPWGTFTFGPRGAHLVTASGARLDLGSVGLPSPLNALGSYAKLQAAMTSVRGTPCSLGTDGGLTNFTAVTALQAVIDAFGAVIALLGAGAFTPNPGGPAAVAAAATALTAYNLVAQDVGKIV